MAMTDKENFYLTFGQQSPARNGWVRVVARDYQHARDIVFSAYENKWAFLYTEDDFKDSQAYYPAGELDVIS